MLLKNGTVFEIFNILSISNLIFTMMNYINSPLDYFVILVVLLVVTACPSSEVGKPTPPELTVEGGLDFAKTKVKLSLTIKNSGGETLEWSSNIERDWLTLDPQKGSVKTEQEVTVSLDRTKLSAGVNQSKLVISAKKNNVDVAGSPFVLTAKAFRDAPPNLTLKRAGITDIRSNQAKCKSEITSLGSSPIVQHGHVWSKTKTPTLGAVGVFKTELGSKTTTSNFNSVLDNLSKSTTYYVRAYAFNSEDTVYSDTVSFKTGFFKFQAEQTGDYIAVYGTENVSVESYNRAYTDVKFVMDKMDSGIKQGLLNSKAKMLVVTNEAELVADISFFMTLLPVESVYTNVDGTDETLPSSTGVELSNTKLELMYLCVYYSLLVEKPLSDKFNELKQAYSQANGSGLFKPGEAYVDGYRDDIHENASNNNALKYGSYLYNLYRLYFGNGKGKAGEFTITTKSQLQAQNPLGFNFIKNNFDK